MVIKLTQETVIEKFRKVHGSKYDYSEIQWQDRYTKLTIICPLHGRFYQNYGTHAGSKAGCSKCSLSQRKATSYTKSEIEYLLSTYETGVTKEEMQKHLPGHSWRSILNKANELDLRSSRKHFRKPQLDHITYPTVQNAYLWGVFYADGYSYKKSGSFQISLWQKDYSYLENLGKVFKLGSVKAADSKGAMIRLELHDKVSIKKLGDSLHLHERKTYNPPENHDFLLDAKMRLAFLIGLTDGDGCLTFDRNRTFKHLRIVQHHNWYPFLRDLAAEIETDTGISFTVNDTNKRGNASLYMGRKQSHQYLVDFIESENLPVLLRKWYNKEAGYNRDTSVYDRIDRNLQIL